MSNTAKWVKPLLIQYVWKIQSIYSGTPPHISPLKNSQDSLLLDGGSKNYLCRQKYFQSKHCLN